MKNRYSLAHHFMLALLVLPAFAPYPAAAQEKDLDPRQLARQMTIERDEWGVPHVTGETLPAAVYGWGYAQAQDHILGIMQRVLAARGELSAVFGPDLTERDLFARRIHLRSDSEERFSELDPEIQEIMTAFAMGVNTFIAENRDALPAWVGQITAPDVLAVSRHALLAFAFNPERTMAALRPHLPPGAIIEGEAPAMPGPADVPRQHPVPAEGVEAGEADEAAAMFGSTDATASSNRADLIESVRRFTTAPDLADSDQIAAALTGPAAFDPLTDEFGSNMWAFAAEKTESGKAILMGNPHLPWELTWYEGHVVVPGELNLYGVSFVGGLIPTIAFNDRLGWSHTVNYPDLEEVYIFELSDDENNPDSIIVDMQPQPLERVDIVLDVRTGDDATTQVRQTYWESPYGPVIHRDSDHAYVVKSAALAGLDFTRQWLAMGKADNLEEFQAALAINAIPMFNTIYADVDGNIYYHWMANLPVRPSDDEGVEPVRVSEATQMWSKIHAADELPHLINPDGGYVQNSNDPPYYTTMEQVLDPETFPAYMPEPRLRLRTQHGLQLIESEEKFSLDETIEAKHSMKMLLGDRLRDDLVAAAREAAERDAGAGAGGESRRAERAARGGAGGGAAVEAGGAGEGEAFRTTPGAAALLTEAADVLEAWDGTVAVDSRGGTLFHEWWNLYEKATDRPWATQWNADEPLTTPDGLGDPLAAVATLVQAAQDVERKWGALDVAWGEVHRLRRGDLDLPMNGGPGSIGCFRVIDYAEAEDGKLVATGGDGWVMAIEFTSPPTARTVLIHGATEDPADPGFNLQTERFIEGNLKPVNFAAAEE